MYTDESGTLAFRDDHSEPSPRADDALIRVLRAGICSTVSSQQHLVAVAYLCGLRIETVRENTCFC